MVTIREIVATGSWWTRPNNRAADVVRKMQRLIAVEVENGPKDDRVAVEEVFAATLAVVRRVRAEIRQHRLRSFLQRVDESLETRSADVDHYRLLGGSLLCVRLLSHQTSHVHVFGAILTTPMLVYICLSQ